jgi:alpha-ketoglutarate-dependent taurine dioxygenase
LARAENGVAAAIQAALLDHKVLFFRGQDISQEADSDDRARRHREAFTSTIYETEHPVVRVHPEMGQPALLLGGFARQIVGFARQIVGLPSDVSRDLLRVFAGYVTRPEHIVRWSWGPGDVAIWDNRATQHYAVNDYGGAHRVMQRVTVSGVRPVGVDGWRSQARRGDASSYQVGLGAPGGHADNNQPSGRYLAIVNG